MRKVPGRRQPIRIGMGPALGNSQMPSPTQEWGYTQESLAETHLVRQGYVIIERNWRGAGAEIDRIAWLGELLCFVEVRARRRADWGRPEATVGRAKQRHLVRAATSYLTRFSSLAMPMARFDVVSVLQDEQGELEVTLFENAFDAGR